ncbi:MFS transporter [Pseudohalioglobus sediminis]|uniref:MFS transporter n=1 Tax=Pseudohalioglobus sediminis TaxID=2606449 RepID=A0A5B0WPQ9_9GAMM|nr:MFS transporter [Pseudohalioglobus sediminis]KAA1188448.1 MFS transporter [Pseudohalioglobus sediminis]
MNRSLQHNIKTIYLLGFFTGFMVIVPVFVPLLQGHGLSMSQVLQTQALFALTIALCEVPSGYLADLWGRRNAILAGSALNAVGFLSLLWADTFVDFLLYEFILGIGFSLVSGADLALLYDTEVYLQENESGGAGAGRSLSRLIAVEAAASGIAGIAASLLLMWSLDSVVLVQAFTGLAPLVLALFLCEAPRPRSAEMTQVKSHGDNARRILELLLFGKPVVLWTAFAIAVFGLLAVYVFWVYQKYWELQGVPLAWFGYIWAAFALTVSMAARFSEALERWLGYRRLLLLIGLLPLCGLLGMAFGSGWWGVLCGFAIQISRGLSMSLFYEALNRRVPGEFRATVNSLVSLGVRAIFIVTGPLLGLALDSRGMQWTLLWLVAIFLPLMGLVLIPLTRRIRSEQAQPAATPGISPAA